ncbi:MAG: thiamine pyrophosphate-binding protein [Proteobacteria bacterium]|nr:thiamine pyrophosphate-binding protein [Pseudomonadota bacterium]
MRTADYIAKFLAEKGLKDVFLVTGGGAMHLNDAFGRCPGLNYIPFHHEQACSMAADSYFRMSGTMAVVNVTSGPGGTNAITGVYGAYVDSQAMFIVSGQVKRETLVRSYDLPLRQLGDQEIDIVRMVEGITKYCKVLWDPNDVRYELEKAFYLATHGRPGPVWLDVPIDIQATKVDEKKMRGFDPEELKQDSRYLTQVNPAVLTGAASVPTLPARLKSADLKKEISLALKKLNSSQRPIIMVGAGVRAASAHEDFLSFIDQLKIPVVTCWNANDTIWFEHPLFVGRPGTVGDRSGNFVVQNADCILILGSRLNIRQISYNWPKFAPRAHKIMIDIDPAELVKPTLSIDHPICAHLKTFFQLSKELKEDYKKGDFSEWIKWGKERLRKYNPVLPSYWDTKDSVNPYCFIDRLFEALPEGAQVVTGDGTACVVPLQAAKLKKRQRLFTNSGCASMGFDLPAAIGASLANGRGEVVCIAGDGSIMMNLQELQTIIANQLPIKLFVLNNRGYHSIRQTQYNFFPDNIVGCGEESKLSFPDFEKLASSFSIPYFKIRNHSDLNAGIENALKSSGASFCEVFLDLKQQFAPKLTSKKLEDGSMVTSPLEDMAPFLDRDELASNMLW